MSDEAEKLHEQRLVDVFKDMGDARLTQLMAAVRSEMTQLTVKDFPEDGLIISLRNTSGETSEYSVTPSDWEAMLKAQQELLGNNHEVS